MITINVDLGDLASLLNIEDGIKEATNGAAHDLAQMAHAKAVELAATRLHSRREMFVQGLSTKQVDEDTWMVSLDAGVRWIDDGQPSHNLLDKLLASPKAKRARDGSKFVVVPFDHSPGQGPGSTPKPQQDLISTVKSEMKKRGLPFGKIETDQQGQAKLGRLHSFDISTAPLKTSNGPGQGKGPIGQVRQGPTGNPFLHNVNVYQSKDKKGKVKRHIMTFRVASSKHAGQGRWEHPGNQSIHILEDAATWAMDVWRREVAPALVDRMVMDLG